jgi:SNF2 family DNA or RNA helicase
MVSVEWENGSQISVVSSWTEKDMVKQIPGATWNNDEKVWKVPLTWAACLQLRGIFGKDLNIGPELREWARLEKQDRIDPAMELRTVTDMAADGFLKSSLWSKLYGFQRAGVTFLRTAGSALLADEMGTGKTVQTLTALRWLCMSGQSPVLIVCPNSMKETWKREAEFWYPEATPYIVRGSATARRKILAQAAKDSSALVIINFEAVRFHSRTAGFGSIALKRCPAPACGGGKQTKITEVQCEVHERELNSIPFHAVVVDEAHRIKDGSAKQSRAIKAASSGATIQHRFALTGTPIANNPADLWSIMNFVDPTSFPTKSKFVDRYCAVSFNAFGGMDIGGLNPATKDEFHRIIQPVMRRMPKALVLPQLPAKIRTVRTVQMTDKQAKAYDQMASGTVTRLEDGSLLWAKEDIAVQTRLLQFSSAYMEKTGEMDEVYTMCEPSPKLDAMEEVISEMGDRPLVIASISRQLLRLAQNRLDKAGVAYGIIAGDTPQWERDLFIQKFQKGELKYMLLTMQAGGVGITLTAADTILFLQRSWSMIENKQTEDRVHRIGSEKHESVTIIDLVTEGTVEENQIASLETKLAILEQVVQDEKILAGAAA